jgi:drug/metabolite transporter (DMT)-like permease
MIALPKPRGFWDYALFALVMTGGLMGLFWFEASDQIGWSDTVVAFAAAVLFVFAIIFARRGEKAKWIAQPTRYAQLVAVVGAFFLIFGAIYADAYLLHHKDVTSSRLRHDIVLAVVVAAAIFWSLRRRPPAKSIAG